VNEVEPAINSSLSQETFAYWLPTCLHISYINLVTYFLGAHFRRGGIFIASSPTPKTLDMPLISDVNAREI